MSVERGYRLVWNSLRLTVEPHGKQWQASVYDERTFVTLHRTERMTAHGAKVAAVEFALHQRFGAAHGQDADRISEGLAWESLSETATQ